MAASLPHSALVLALSTALSGCGGHSSTPSGLLALDGPPLALVAQNNSATWTGAMERGCMAGFGHITLRKTDGSTACSGDVDHPATDKGRMYADLFCNDGTVLTLVYRNLGPDQGMGLVRVNMEEVHAAEEPGGGEQTVLFYHPSAEEAKRRLGQVREDIARAVKLKREKNKNGE